MLTSCHGLVNTPYTVTRHAIQTWHRTNFFHQNLKWLLVLLLNKELTLTHTSCIKLSHVSTLFPGNLLLLKLFFLHLRWTNLNISRFGYYSDVRFHRNRFGAYKTFDTPYQTLPH